MRQQSVIKGLICQAVLLVTASLADNQGMPVAEAPLLPGTARLSAQGDFSLQMVTGIDRFLVLQTSQISDQRGKQWTQALAAEGSRDDWIKRKREILRQILGAVDRRLPVTALELRATSSSPAQLAETDQFKVYAVRWPVFQGVYGEGLWLRPKQKPLANVVAIPDADQSPELICGLIPGLAAERQFARRLAEHGCEVLVPALLSRADNFSGNATLERFTNQPHREWIYRQAYELGRHIIGYEVQKVSAALDFFTVASADSKLKAGVVGFGEGGLVAFYAAALDVRIHASLVSGYFNSRERLWEEPIYRNVFGLLRNFGDAEVATMIYPRSLTVEHSEVPAIHGPPERRTGRSGAAPGRLETPDYVSVEAEFERARQMLNLGTPDSEPFRLIAGTEGTSTGPVSDRALVAFLNAVGIPAERCGPPGEALPDVGGLDLLVREQRQVTELQEYTQKVFRGSEDQRAACFWSKIDQLNKAGDYQSACVQLRQEFRDQVIGTFGPPSVPANARARQILERPAWVGHEVLLDVYPDVFAWGYLLVPKDLRAGERRPVVVCQHGLEGVPADVIKESGDGYNYYKAFGARLAERGFVVFVPHNPYRGGDRFRGLQRKANPLGASLFSIIVGQHERLLEWLGGLPFVDRQRIAFYGLSYGGKTAMRVPAILEGYAMSICSGDFNEWVRKNVSVDSPVSYMFTGEYEMPEWNLGQTFNYAEMAGLIAPRPFMVERGHSDGVGLDEWVAYEYAKVARLYDRLGLADCTRIEYFNGPHTINGVGTFDFLQRHLRGKGLGNR